MSLAVFNIRAVSRSSLNGLDRHCRNRSADGWSAIDPSRSHLNEVLYGSSSGISRSIDDWYSRTGAKKPTKQAEKPFYSLVLSASSEHFKNGHDDFVRRAMSWLQSEAGDDLVHVELHLDETTPHLHVVVFPTYERKARIPGRKKKGETDFEFEQRKQAAMSGRGVRTVSRTSHHWAEYNSFDRLRRSYCAATELGYGESRVNKRASITRDWVKSKVSKIRSAIATLRHRDAQSQALVASLREGAASLEKERALMLEFVDQFKGMIGDLPVSARMRALALFECVESWRYGSSNTLDRIDQLTGGDEPRRPR